MEHTPDVDVVVTLDVEDQLREMLQWPEAQARKAELGCVTRRTGGRVTADVRVRMFQCVDKPECSLPRALTYEVADGFINVSLRYQPQNDGLGCHPRAP